MEKGKALAAKREGQRKRKVENRKEQLMAAYINKKHPLIYKEAELYYIKLNELYPSKLDLRKTLEFKVLSNAPMTSIKDNMCLDIPLVVAQPVVEVPSVQHTQIIEESAKTLPADLETLDGTLEGQLPAGVMQSIIKDLQSDPYINQMMREIEDLMNKEIEEGDIDIDIEIDDRLENELQLW